MNAISASAAILAITLAGAAAQTANTPAFSEFRLVVERNIFDPDRRQPEPWHQPEPRPPPSPRHEYLDVQGIVLTDGKPTIFLAGSDPGRNGAFTVGDDVAGFAIADATTEAVLLRRQGEDGIMVRVGSRLTMTNGDLTITRPSPSPSPSLSPTATAPAAPAPTAPFSTPAATPADNGNSGSPEVSDVLRRLQERRKKELGQ